jgi:hypothetical protein
VHSFAQCSPCNPFRFNPFPTLFHSTGGVSFPVRRGSLNYLAARVQRSCARGLLSPFFPFNRSLSSGDRPSLHASREHAN